MPRRPPPIEIIDGLRNPTNSAWLPKPRKELNYHPKNLHFLHSPIVDLGLPSPEKLDLLLAELQQRLAKGEKLYIHCWGGRGRAGTVGACLLALMWGVPVPEALERVQRAFDTRKDEQRRSPETDEQHAFVKEYVESRRK
jgi:protein-tyrosine phosphatase